MRYLIAAHTDVGIRKEINQDSYVIKEAQTSLGRVCLCVLCDGMGGLAKGELASAAAICSFGQWFENEFPLLLESFSSVALREQWMRVVHRLNFRLARHGARNCGSMGTTLVALLLMEGRYYIMNVGDSRVYALHDRVYQLTKDQSLVQRQVDMGRLMPGQAAMHPQRNILLQCIGASEAVMPDYYEGAVHPETLFLLCSDGFCHRVREEELFAQLNPVGLHDETTMKECIMRLTELSKSRMETDNISAVAVKVSLEE